MLRYFELWYFETVVQLACEIRMSSSASNVWHGSPPLRFMKQCMTRESALKASDRESFPTRNSTPLYFRKIECCGIAGHCVLYMCMIRSIYCHNKKYGYTCFRVVKNIFLSLLFFFILFRTLLGRIVCEILSIYLYEKKTSMKKREQMPTPGAHFFCANVNVQWHAVLLYPSIFVW